MSVNATLAEYPPVDAMLTDDHALFRNARRYAKSKFLSVLCQHRLGHGSDGSVWRSSRPSAIKAFYRTETFGKELECYSRLKNANVTKINGLNVPVLEGSNSRLRVIEISFVQPPYFLDFGKVYIDRPPTDFYDSQKMANAQAQWRSAFGKRWPDVSAALYELRCRFGIHYVDPRPGNIDFGDDDDDEGVWDEEPPLDYSEYD